MKRVKSFLLGFLIGALIFGSITVFADTTEIKAFLSDIKISLNGKVLELKDANNNSIQPIVYNGTTYLPVRAIGEIFDKKIEWEQETSTIKISEKTQPLKTGGDNLSEIQYAQEGNLDITIFEGVKYVTPVGVTRALAKDHNVNVVFEEINRENSTVNFYYKNIKGKTEPELIIKDYPIILLNISSHSFAISYDDYKNDLLPRILQAVDQQN